MITTKVADVLAQTYDFIIVGGGTAGLTLASRLSEDPSITVIVLEAGDNRTGDPMTSVPVPYGRQIGNPKYDWCFTTTKQKYSNDKVVPWARGKGLGGSSNINFTTWSLPPAVDVDVFEKLGNVGWNWNEFSRYIKKIEQFNAPNDEGTDSSDEASGDDIDRQSASARPLQTSIPPHHTIYALASETLNNLGVETLHDPYSGQVNGTWVPASTIDPRTWSRSTSATAYLLPNQDRPNLFVLTQALVSRVILRDDNDGFVATGVEFIHEDIQHILNARKEVILSAGAIKSPQLLELSGIGRKDVLSKIGVDVKIELPGVGENLQEHNFVVVSYELDPSNKHETFDALRSPEKMQEAERLYAQGQGPLRMALSSLTFLGLEEIDTPDSHAAIARIKQDIDDYKNEPGIDPGLREQLDLQLATLESKHSPDVEISTNPLLYSAHLVPEENKRYISFITFLLHPLSRGTIHCTSVNPRENPEIDPHYFERDSDVEVLVQGIKYIRLMANTQPLKSAYVGEEVQPGSQTVTDEEIRQYIKDTNGTSWHAVGTCSMLPRHKQGVVDPELKVYGTKNLRVADLSIIPLQIAAHTQATAYVIGEKASDLILMACRAKARSFQ